jgi:hypothetical protein
VSAAALRGIIGGRQDHIMSDDEPKSALELAMERLRKKDADAGVAGTPLTDAQRTRIAEVRNFYDAKLAERDEKVARIRRGES